MPYYFKTIKEAVRNTINNFKGNDNTKFKIIITCEFTTPLSFDIIEAHCNRTYEELLTIKNFDDVYSNIENDFIAWLDEFQERGSGFVFKQIIKSAIHLSKTNHLRLCFLMI